MMGYNVYLTGQAGSGKTYLLNQYIRFLKDQGVPVAITASTGIAATHLSGQTIHSWAGIGIRSELSDKDLSRIAAKPQVRDRVRKAKVLIIDEISMLHSKRLDLVNSVCRYIRKNDQPFGGLQVILCGDFFQLPPVSEDQDPKSEFAFYSRSWEESDLKVCYLDEQHRQWDEDFLRVLNDIRSQDVGEGTFEKISSRLNAALPAGIKPTRLYTHNIDVDAINTTQLGRLKGLDHTYDMTFSGDEDLAVNLSKGCLAPQRLVLKAGAQVMFVKNNPAKGYVNGTLGEVIQFDEEGFPIVRTSSGREINVPPSSWILEDKDKPVAEITQVPLRLAWAITVHKSQGMSLDAAEIDLSKSFTYGMGYVALSRVRSLSGIRLLGINQMAFQVNQTVGEIDRQFQSVSRLISSEITALEPKQIRATQSQFLGSLIDNPLEASDNLFFNNLFKKYFS
jgi:ATP-dependent exoDNAse (exonuclease V) alpha subunit